MEDDPDSMTPLQRERYAELIAIRMEAMLEEFVKLNLPKAGQYVFIAGLRGKIGALITNVDDREVLLEYLAQAQSKLKQ